jgi:adenosylcobinamide-GDP ribazoletransferase
MMSRWQLVVLLITTPYAKKTGLGLTMQQYAPIKPLWILLSLTLLTMIMLFPIGMSLAYLLSWGVLMGYRQHLLTRLAGTTGDTAGAWVEISEALLLLFLVISFSAIITA